VIQPDVGGRLRHTELLIMIRFTRFSRPWLFVIAWLTVSCGTGLPESRAASPGAATFSTLQTRLLERNADLEQFRSPGPFDVTVQKDRDLRLSPTERYKADAYWASPAEKAPLVIILHGHDSTKEAHAKQAANLASWGMHTLAVQLPKAGPWDANGRALARIVSFIHRTPSAIDRRIDASRIVLAGHSFGAYAVTVAMAQGTPVTGGILLDAALFGNASPDFMRKISKPMMLLAADEAVSPVRYREYFFSYLGGDVAKVSVKDATHEDAQYPSQTSLENAGVDPDITEALQLTFVSALTAATFSLSATRTLDYAWASFSEAIRSGRFLDPKKK